MAITNGYVTLDEFKLRLGITSTNEDTELESKIEMASRYIDQICDRYFYQVDAIRYFTPEHWSEVTVDDLVELTDLSIDPVGLRDYSQLWNLTDYDLTPEGADTLGAPFTRVVISGAGLYTFPRTSRAVRITGTWGWPAVPAAIKEATILEATRAYKRKTSPFGTIGSAGVGGQIRSIMMTDPQVKEWTARYIRYGVEAVF